MIKNNLKPPPIIFFGQGVGAAAIQISLTSLPFHPPRPRLGSQNTKTGNSEARGKTLLGNARRLSCNFVCLPIKCFSKNRQVGKFHIISCKKYIFPSKNKEVPAPKLCQVECNENRKHPRYLEKFLDVI